MSSLNELQQLIHDKFGIDASTLDPHESLREKAKFDSLALVEFLFAIEDHFKISLSDESSDIDTLAELAALVDQVKATQAAQAA